MIFSGRLKRQIHENFGKNPLNEGHIYYNGSNRLEQIGRLYFNKDHGDAELVDEITWSDLEMDSVFLRVSHCNSFIGEQILYDRMHNLRRHNSDKYLKLFESNPSFRESVEFRLNHMSKKQENYYMYEVNKCIKGCKIGSNLLFRLIQLIILLVIVAFIVTKLEILPILLVVILFTNLIISFTSKRKYESFMSSISSFLVVFANAKWLCKQKELEDIIDDDIKATVERMNTTAMSANALVAFYESKAMGDMVAVLADYLYSMTLMDIISFNRIVDLIENKSEDVDKIMEFVGNVDADISILSYRASIENWCEPEFSGLAIEAKSLAHPLIDNPVTCDLNLKSKAIITGPNASGKSTFMKAVAINAILAQTINTCVAEQFKLDRIGVMTCMSLRDDVISGDSYYLREAKYIQRMLSEINSSKRYLIVIDEILKGTNTMERVAASKAILEYINATDSLALVATHDMEIADTVGFEKYHFDTQIKDNEIYFDYQIHDGVSKSTNAIALLKCLDYPDSIIESARDFISKAN